MTLPRSRDARPAALAQQAKGEHGDTLVELLVTIVIMGIAIAAILGGILAAVEGGNVHRSQTTAQTYVRSYAETIESAIDASQSKYTACARTTSYSPGAVGYTVGSGYTASVTSVEFWTGSQQGSPWTQRCDDGDDPGIQQLTLQVSRTNDARVSETLVIIVRQPCRNTGDFADQLCS